MFYLPVGSRIDADSWRLVSEVGGDGYKKMSANQMLEVLQAAPVWYVLPIDYLSELGELSGVDCMDYAAISDFVSAVANKLHRRKHSCCI